MISYTKGNYISPINGVTNTETAWKVTSDKEGYEIIDITQLSADTVNTYYSNIMIPKGDEVYIWYQMKLSNNELKEWAGPYPYQSRESNISSDLKPLIRIETPYTTIDEDELKSGSNVLKVNSSVFRGDFIDGILAVTWMIKNPKGEIILFKPYDMINVNDLTINRTTLGLSQYEYMDVYIKHHSANGAVSDFGMTRYNLKIYPFKFSGDEIINSVENYKFSIIPYDSNNPALKSIRVVDATTGAKIYEITNVSILLFTIPAYTLSADTEYVIEAYTLNTPATKYPLKLDTPVRTKPNSIVVEYDDSVVYDLNSIIPKGFISTYAKGEYTLVDGVSYVLNKDYSISRYTVDKLNAVFNIFTMDIDTDLYPYLSSIDLKLLNLKSGELILVCRINGLINIVSLSVIGDRIIKNPNKSVVSYPCKDINQNLSNTVTLTLDNTAIYISTIDNTYLNFIKFDVVKRTITKLVNRDKLTPAIYNPEDMLIIANGLDTIFSVGGNPSDELYYEYIIKTGQWIPRGIIEADTIAPFQHEAILLQNRSVLFTKNDGNGLYIMTIDNLSNLVTVPSTVNLYPYNLSFIDDEGTLYMLDHFNSKLFTVESHKQ